MKNLVFIQKIRIFTMKNQEFIRKIPILGSKTGFGAKKIGLMAAQIQNIALTKLTVGAAATFHGLVLKRIRETTAEALYLQDLVGPYEEKIKQLRLVVNRVRAFVATPRLKRTDTERDRFVGVIMNTVRTNRSNPIERKREAANRLDTTLGGFKGLARDERTTQTAKIRSMLAILAEKENAAAAATLHLEEEIEGLRAANDLFSEALFEKAQEVAEREALMGMKTLTLRAEARQLYLGVVERVNAYAIARPSEAIEGFIKQLNGLVEAMR